LASGKARTVDGDASSKVIYIRYLCMDGWQTDRAYRLKKGSLPVHRLFVTALGGREVFGGQFA